jgi:hypothetical protein
MALHPRSKRVFRGSLVCLVSLQLACVRYAKPVQSERGRFALRLLPGELSAEDRALLLAFLAEAEKLLPPRVKAVIGQPVYVAFSPASPPSTPLRAPSCQASEELTGNVLGSLAGGTPERTLRITLHGGFVAVVRAGPDHSVSFPCGQKTLYRLGLATLLHEVLHAYDQRTQASAAPQYAALHAYTPKGVLRRMRSRNEIEERSPDPYEFHDLAESFAVHGEYFLLDSEYRCRLPASYRFFAHLLDYTPFAQAECRLRTVVYDGGLPIDIDPARVYAVHYLWASAGDAVQSRFGHAMLRLVVCGRERKQVDSRCEQDLSDHVVLSFSANTHGDLHIQMWKGLLGGYRSQLFVRPLSEVIVEYTEAESRDLYSFPLRLSRAEIEALVLRVLEVYWTYAGRYYFLTNNCGTETLNLLRSLPPFAQARGLHALTPRGIRDVLLRKKLADPLPLPDAVALERRGLFFPSARKGNREAYRRLHASLGVRLPLSADRYLNRMPAQARRKLFARQLDVHQLAQLYTLEGAALLRKKQDMDAKLVPLYLRAERMGTHAKLRAQVAELMARGELYEPWQWPRAGYGVPLLGDPVDVPPAPTPEFLNKLRTELQRMLSEKLPKEQAELAQIEANQRWLAAELLRKTAGTSPSAQAK